ncbi:MAG: DUF4230 domain-containing protein [Longimonas sp.]|uniref:DUF4230 domain-containing protein n=1 Tax=Longimonas sp. TaxID=2039626 RepID=UPI003974CD82
MKERVVGGLLALFLVALGAGLAWWVRGPSEADIQRAVVSTVQEEAPSAFLVTGILSIQVEDQVAYTESVAPEFYQTMRRYGMAPGVDLVTAEAQVRVSGRVTYGFSVYDLTADRIEKQRDGSVRVAVPSLQVQTVAPDLETLEVKTESRGWLKLFSGDMEATARDEAMAGVQKAMRAQAEQRIREGAQARANTEEALEAMLTPPLRTAGLADPQFAFHFQQEDATGPVLRAPED